MSHPTYLGIDPSAPYSQEFPALEPAYEELSKLPFFELVERHLKSCGNDPAKLRRYCDFIFEFYSNGINQSFYAEMVGYSLKSIQRYLEHNGVEYDFKQGVVSGGSYEGIPE